MNQAVSLRKRLLLSGFNAKRPKGAYWGIAGTVGQYQKTAAKTIGYSGRLVHELIVRVRTDLDAFSRGEMAVLENHGYLLADASVRRRVPELIAANPDPPIPPHPEFMSETKVRLALRHSHRRFSLRRLFQL